MDFGTGDGAYVHRAATSDARLLAIGVDANGENLREVSWRAGRKPARGGRPNALFGRLSLDEAPGELEGLADRLTVNLPWGTLLRAVALPDGEALRRLAAIGKPGASVRFVFGYGGAEEGLSLPALAGAGALERLRCGYQDAGLRVAVRALPAGEVRQLPTTWAGKLAAPGARPRPFVEVTGRIS